MAVFVSQIIADDHANIVKLQALRGMNASRFIVRVLTDGESLAIVQILAYAKVAYYYVVIIAVVSIDF